jgi:plasmid replication initiation protein
MTGRGAEPSSDSIGPDGRVRLRAYLPLANTTWLIDLFVAFGDVPLRDDREGMSVPLVSLSKNKRTAPIVWASASADHARYVRVTANATHGMATICPIRGG